MTNLTRWELRPGLSFEEWAAIGEQLRHVETHRAWWWGEWLLYGEAAFGERYSQAVDGSDYTYAVLKNTAWVARAFPPSRRRYHLPWTMHQAVAHLEPAEQDRLLDWVDETGATRQMLREAVQAVKAITTGQPHNPYATLEDAVGRLLRLIERLWPDDQRGARARVVEMMMEVRDDYSNG